MIMCCWSLMTVPAGIGCLYLGLGVYFAWWMATLYVFLLGLLMRRRFRAGHWKSLRVIEPHALPPETEPVAP
jgi:Na+-driven multidrug efflux pump